MKKRILLVDDELYVVSVIARKLQQLGHEVLSAADGQEGLATALASPPDLVITDFQMPLLTGLEMAIQLRQSPLTAQAPVLMLSARGHRLDAPQLQQTNIKAVMPKPFSMRELMSKIDELLGIHHSEPTHSSAASEPKESSAIAQFSDRLTQAYEEVNSLVQVAELLKDLTAPASAVRGVCERIVQTFTFSWTVAQFAPGPTAGALSGQTLAAGPVPCPKAQVKALLPQMQAETARASHSPVLTVQDSPLARASGGEVIVHPIKRQNQIIGIMAAGGKSGRDADITSGEIRFLQAAAQLIGIYVENAARFEEQRAMLLGMLRAMTAAIDAKDPYTLGHSERVAHLAAQMAGAIGLDEHTIDRYHVAGLLHDVGKIGVPEAVLCKCGRLNDAEFALIKRHPKIGHRILKDIPGLEDILPGVLHHHEKWDGRGYPTGLSGEQIPLLARVLALADTFDAMSSDRSYRKRIARQQVLEEVSRCAGTQFDPDLAAKFVELSFEGYDQMTMQTPPTLQDAA